MEHIKGIENYIISKPAAVTIGKFDALHKGHRLLIDNICKKKSEGMKSVVIIFSNSPRIAFGNENEQAKFIITKKERIKLLSSYDVDCLLELTFDETMIKMEPEDFVFMLVDKLDMSYVCVGSDFRFGHKGRGDVSLLNSLKDKMGFSLDCEKKVDYEGKVISSTRIRDCIKDGNIKSANAMLGYDFFTMGKVAHGNRIGRTIEFPTINLIPSDDKILPPFGVYLTKTRVKNKDVYGVTNIGIRPTIEEKIKKPTIETHLFDFNDDVYEKDVKVSFLDFIRTEQQFDSVDSLKKQIIRDEKCAREALISLH